MTKINIKKIDPFNLIIEFSKENVLKKLNFLETFEIGLNNPMKIQERLLKKILDENKNTFYGKKYKFKNIKSIEEFQEKVPLVKYPDIKEYVERIKKGERNVLTNKKIIYFATTSGTTSEPKFIPITKIRMKLFMKQMILWGYFIARKNIKTLKGQTLYFAGTDICGYTDKGVPHGNMSGYILNNLPWYAKKRLAIPTEIYDVPDYNERTRLIALISIQKNVSQIGFAEPIEAIMFFDYLKKNKENLLRELRILGKKKIAKQLEKKEFTPSEIWPNLTMVSCIKSHMNGIYVDTLTEKIGSDKVEIRDPGIYSSEGGITLCISEDGNSGINLFNTTFFEFLEFEKEDAKPITIDKLELGKKYMIILTTQEGIYRYNIEDIVKVTGFIKKVPLVKFVHRNKFLDLTGEKAPETEIVKAVNQSAKEAGVKISYFTVVPRIESLETRPRYEILIETETKDLSKLKKMLKLFDKTMMYLVLDYDCMRNEYGRLDPPVLSLLKDKSYTKFNKQRIVKVGQQKLIQISKNPDFKNNFEIEKTIK